MPDNVADITLKILADWGVKSAYGVSGDAIFPLLDALSRQDRIKYYGAASETGAAFMASYEAKLTGQPALCISTSGPGAANLVNGLADAYFDQAPVIAITGQVATDKIGTGAKQYFNQQQLFKNFSSKSELIANPVALMPALLAAISTAVNKKTVCHLSIPEDIFLRPAPVNTWPILAGQSYSFGSGLAAGLDEAANRLENCQRPVFILGTRQRGIANLALSIAEKKGAAVFTAQQAKGVVPDSHPLILGGIGEGYVPPILNIADLIFIIGTASFEMNYLPVNTTVLQMAEDNDNLHFERIANGITGPLRQLLKLLAEKITPRRNNAWGEEINKQKNVIYEQLMADSQNIQMPIHPARLMTALTKAVASDAIIVCDIGSYTHWFDRSFQAQEQTILVSTNWRSMGSGIPGAIGAKAASPAKQVVALIGDGGFLISMAELMTAVKYQLPITFIVVNNHLYNLEKQKMSSQGLNPFGNDIKIPHLASLAKLSGAQGYRIDEPNQLEETLQQALSCGQTAVVDVQAAEAALPNIKASTATV